MKRVELDEPPRKPTEVSGNLFMATYLVEQRDRASFRDFTDAILHGVAGEASPSGGPVTANSLAEYVQSRMGFTTGRLSPEVPGQVYRPTFEFNAQREMILSSGNRRPPPVAS